MGTWGLGIFSDDTACDVRDDFRELAAEGLSPAAATRRLLVEYAGILHDPDEGPLFWLALAAAQCRTGRLVASVRQRALRIIDRGDELVRWQDEGDPRLVERRRQVLLKLRAELLAPQRAVVRLPRPFHFRTDWQVGHAISYRLCSGRLALFRVLYIDTKPNGDQTPIVEVGDWRGTAPPPRSAIQRLRYRRERFAELQWTSRLWARKHGSKFALYAEGPRDTPGDRAQIVATGLKVRRTDTVGATYFGGWKHLDDFLLTTYGLK